MATQGYKYYTRLKQKISYYPNALRIINDEKLIIDAKYIEVIEAAEYGHCTAWLELQSGFAKGGKGIPRNYKMARYYTDIMLKETTKCPILRKDPQLKFDSLRASAYLEYNSNNLERAKLEFLKLVKFMVSKMPFDNWDFQIFDILNNLKLPPQ